MGVKRTVQNYIQMHSVTPNDVIRDNRHTLKHRKFYLNMRENLLEGNRALEG